MADMPGSHFTMIVEDYRGELCVFVSSKGGEVIVPLRQIQEAADARMAKVMEAVSRGEYTVPMTPAKPDDHTDAEESLPDILADALRRIRKLESIFDYQGLDNLADEIQRRLVTRLRNVQGM